MGFRFLSADKVTDPKSAERVLTKYRNRETTMALDSQSFDGTVLNVKASGGTLRIEFTWSHDRDQGPSEIGHIQRTAAAKIGSMVRFKVGTDEFIGLLSGMTELPKGATTERYLDSPFVMTFAFSAQDQKPIIADFEESGIIGVPVPANIVEQLPISEDLPYDPHITVCFFPKLSPEDVEKILPIAAEAADIVGSFDVMIDGGTVFPNQQEDGTYPHVAKILSEGLKDYHDLVVEMCEHYFPGKVDTTFALKNYKPHLTLSYNHDPSPRSVPKSLAWNVDHLTLNLGKTRKFPIPLTEGSLREGGSVPKPYLQFGEIQIPIHVVGIGNREGSMRLRLKEPKQARRFDELEGKTVMLVTKNADQELEINQVIGAGPDEFQLFYRPVVVYMPKSAATTLRFVSAVARDRGLTNISNRLSKFLDFDSSKSEEEEEPEDKEALGPGFEGTDEHIVTYVKSPQTQVIVEEPKFTRKLPLHERI